MQRLTMIRSMVAFTVGCTVVAPGTDGGTGGKEPGAPFADNVCFLCSLGRCGISANACVQEAQCATWLDCVGVCPTASNGVSADMSCVLACGLPVSAQVLYTCIQQHANGILLGCEAACAPLPGDAGVAADASVF